MKELQQQKAGISETLSNLGDLSCGVVNSPILRVSNRGWMTSCPRFLSFYDSKILILFIPPPTPNPDNRSTNQCLRHISKYASPRSCRNCWSNLPKPPFGHSRKISSSGPPSTYSFLTSSPWFPLEVEVGGGGGKVLENWGGCHGCSLGVGTDRHNLWDVQFLHCFGALKSTRKHSKPGEDGGPPPRERDWAIGRQGYRQSVLGQSARVRLPHHITHAHSTLCLPSTSTPPPPPSQWKEGFRIPRSLACLSLV